MLEYEILIFFFVYARSPSKNEGAGDFDHSSGDEIAKTSKKEQRKSNIIDSDSDNPENENGFYVLFFIYKNSIFTGNAVFSHLFALSKTCDHSINQIINYLLK